MPSGASVPSRVRSLVLAAVCVVAASALASAEIPEAVPDLPVLGAGPRRGAGLATTPAQPVQPSIKVVDGKVSDWVGSQTWLGGTAVYSAGEYVYQDYLMDDWGADDGQDAARAEILDPLIAAEPRTYRTEALAQALGEQFGVRGNETIAAEVHYGDSIYPAYRKADGSVVDLKDHADIEEVRVAADADRLLFLVRTTGMIQTPGTAVIVLIDTEEGGSYAAPGGIQTAAEWAFVFAGDRLLRAINRGGTLLVACPEPCTPPWKAATNTTDYVNAVEVSIDRSFLGPLPPALRIGVATGVINADGTDIADVSQGRATADWFNLAFRFDEPIRVWMDHDQALALLAGSVDRYLTTIDLSKLETGYTETFQARPGYYERIYVSDSPVNEERDSNSYFQGAFQHYGIYLPSSYRAGSLSPATWWLHYRGGHAHDAPAWVPGLVRQLGEARGNVVITPGARGTSSWYVGRGHEDFLEVWDDVMANYSIDPDRVYVSGYSMGGFASWLLGMLYPDRFAGAFPTAGPPTQGLWDGVGLVTTGANGGDGPAELTYNIVENARNVPYVIYHGTNDELVPVSGIVRMASRFAELGYRHRLYLFPGAEHYTLAVVDEWVEAARYLDAFRRDPNPPRVTYRVWPALERAVERISTPTLPTVPPSPLVLSYTFDGAYWVDGLTVRSGDPADPKTMGTIDARTFGRGAEEVLALPEAGTAGQVAPYVMTGLRWHHAGTLAPRNAFSVTLANIATARLDIARMGLGTAAPITATVTTDGAARLWLAGTWAQAPTVTGAAASYDVVNRLLSVTFDAAGTYTLTIAP